MVLCGKDSVAPGNQTNAVFHQLCLLAKGEAIEHL
jgi:hypothetical protein